jgi:hypothetical protein
MGTGLGASAGADVSGITRMSSVHPALHNCLYICTDRVATPHHESLIGRSCQRATCWCDLLQLLLAGFTVVTSRDACSTDHGTWIPYKQQCHQLESAGCAGGVHVLVRPAVWDNGTSGPFNIDLQVLLELEICCCPAAAAYTYCCLVLMLLVACTACASFSPGYTSTPALLPCQ